MSAISDAFAKAPSARPGVQKTTELARILALPRRKLDLDAGTVDGQPILDLNSLYVTNPGKCIKHPKCPVCISGAAGLWPTQSAALTEAERAWGLFGALGVGAGKSLISLLLPDVFGAQRTVLLVPSALKNQLKTRDFFDYGRHFKLSLDKITVVSYDELSIATGAFVLDRIEPDLIVADECFPAGTDVITDAGIVSIDRVVNDVIGFNALSLNNTSGELEWKRIVRRIRKITAEPMVEIVHSVGSLRCTLNHKIWTENRGYITAGKLVRDDTLCLVRLGDCEDTEHVEILHEGVLQNVRLRGSARSRSCTFDSVCTVRKEEVQTVPRYEANILLGKLSSKVQQFEVGDTSESAEDVVSRMRYLQKNVYGSETRKEHSEVLFSELLFFSDQQFTARKRSYREASRAFRAKSGRQGRSSESLGNSHRDRRSWQSRESVQRLWEGGYVTRKMPSLCRERSGGAQESVHVLAHADEQSFMETGSSCENICQDAREDVSIQRRKRPAHCSTDVFSREAADTYGISYTDGCCERSIRMSSAKLQSRPGLSGSEVGDRGGRSDTYKQEMEIFGSSERVSSGCSRVVSVEILERGSNERSTVGAGEDLYVYDLEVEDNHNYVADGIVVSNCHSLARISSARTKRWIRYMQTHPSTRFCGMSGTVTRRSLRDISHLTEIALRAGSPLPYRWSDLQEWADALDPIRDPIPIGALKAFVDPSDPRLGGDADAAREAAREGFRKRLVETPGVVATSESWEGASLVITALKPTVPKPVLQALSNLFSTWEIGEEEIEDKMRLVEISRQLALGFYYKWIWPGDKPDREWLEARATWHKAVRYILQRSRAGMDSPLLVTRAVMSGEIDDGETVEAWEAWRRVKDRPAPPVEPVWIDDFAIREALAWAKKQTEPVIIWYSHSAVGDALSDGGYPVYGSGTDAGEADPAREPVIVCSIRAQGTGKNLQRYARSLVVEAPASGATTEQLYGRTHRPGQQADEVNYEVFMHTPELEEAMQRAVADALYVQQTQGQRQKLLVARRVNW